MSSCVKKKGFISAIKVTDEDKGRQLSMGRQVPQSGLTGKKQAASELERTMAPQ